MSSIVAKKNHLILVAAAVLVLLIIYFQALLPLWKNHLEIDTWVWFLRMDYFLKHHSFSGLSDSEFLPATLLFLFIPRWLSGWLPLTYSAYLSSALITNLFLLSVLLILVIKNSLRLQAWLFLPLLLMLGPIFLFRFDTLVALLVILSFLLFKKKKLVLSSLALGLATAMKIYPVILLPYYLLVIFRRRSSSSLSALFSFIVCYFSVQLFPVIAFIFLGGNFSQILTALSFHGLKYVSIESLPGSLLTAWSLLVNHQTPRLLGGYGVWGITTPIIVQLGLPFFNYFWIFPVGLFYAFLFKAKSLTKNLNPAVLFFLILLFLISSKNLHPQYLLWFMVFFPFVRFKKSFQSVYLVVFFFLLIIAFSNQLVYPLLYTSFTESFYLRGEQQPVFFLQLIRNFSLLFVACYSFKSIFIKKTLN